MTKQQIPTPALLVDLDAFEANIARAATEAKAAGKRFRPHAKAHKCVEIARRQLAAGACGGCVATVSEAEMMARADIAEILLTSPVADPIKIARIVDTGAMVAVVAVGEVPLPHPQASRATAVAAATPGCMSRRGRCRPADRMAERQVDDAPLGVSPGMLTDARAVSGP